MWTRSVPLRSKRDLGSRCCSWNNHHKKRTSLRDLYKQSSNQVRISDHPVAWDLERCNLAVAEASVAAAAAALHHELLLPDLVNSQLLHSSTTP